MLLDIDLATAVLLDKVQKGKGDQMSDKEGRQGNKSRGKPSFFIIMEKEGLMLKHMIIC